MLVIAIVSLVARHTLLIAHAMNHFSRCTNDSSAKRPLYRLFRTEKEIQVLAVISRSVGLLRRWRLAVTGRELLRKRNL